MPSVQWCVFTQQTAGREAGADGHGQQQRRQPGGGDACSPTLPIHSSPAVRQQQQPSASSSTSSSSLLQPTPPLIGMCSAHLPPHYTLFVSPNLTLIAL